VTPRERALAVIHASLGEGRALLATGAGTGLSAAAAEAGGADLVVIYNSGRFRANGHSSLSGLLPFGNANDMVVQLAREVLSAVTNVPVLAGVCAVDPYVDLDALVHQLRDMGISGVQNFPTVTLYGQDFLDDLEATGISFEREVELVRAARRAGLLTGAFVTTPSEAERMALAGVDILSPHLGVTRSSDAASALAEAAAQIDVMTEAARKIRDDLLFLFHGGPAATAADVGEILDVAVGLHGFFAASSVERQPVHAAVERAAASFKSLAIGSSAQPEFGVPDFEIPAPPIPIELDVESLPAYLVQRDLAERDADVAVLELGGGVSNIVLHWRSGGREGVIKQSRPKLRVEEDWFSDVRRVLNERDAIALLASRLPPGCVPSLSFSDDDMLTFGMECAPADAVLWKPRLLAGCLEPDRARQAGLLLRQIHDATRDDPIVARRFVAQPLITQNRLDPWYRFAAKSNPDVADTIEYAISRLLDVRRVLVHGDFVPKNMFLLEHGVLVLDFEVAHFGNPGYDVATFLNHMLLKGFRAEEHHLGFADLAMAFWQAYSDQLGAAELELVETETPLQLGALILARVDGKSRVEYLTDNESIERARSFGRSVLRRRFSGIEEVLGLYRDLPRSLNGHL
jgi:predicted TIM-barrel enzyme/tRNA A-37 threonylcarbamoyl transferase component Bud32